MMPAQMKRKFAIDFVQIKECKIIKSKMLERRF